MQLGFLAAIPYIAYFIFINLGGTIADKLQNSNTLSVIATRRLAMIVGRFLPGVTGVYFDVIVYIGYKLPENAVDDKK